MLCALTIYQNYPSIHQLLIPSPRSHRSHQFITVLTWRDKQPHTFTLYGQFRNMGENSHTHRNTQKGSAWKWTFDLFVMRHHDAQWETNTKFVEINKNKNVSISTSYSTCITWPTMEMLSFKPFMQKFWKLKAGFVLQVILFLFRHEKEQLNFLKQISWYIKNNSPGKIKYQNQTSFVCFFKIRDTLKRHISLFIFSD